MPDPDVTQIFRSNGIQSKLIGHTLTWAKKDGIKTPWNSNDPAVVTNLVNLMQRCGFAVDCPMWKGLGTDTDWPMYAHFMRVNDAYIESGGKTMQFALLFDKNITGNPQKNGQFDVATATANVIKQFSYAYVQGILNSDSYIPEKAVFEFNSGIDIPTFEAAFPGVKLWSWHKHFSWPGPGSMADGTYKTDLLNPAMMCPGLLPAFFDGGATASPASPANPDFSKEGWNNGDPARMSEWLGGYTLFAQIDAIKATGKQFPYVLTPLDDFVERTYQFLQAIILLTGVRIGG